MVELIILSLIAGYAYCVGQALLCIARVSFATSAGWIAASISLGLSVIAHTVLALGLFGGLKCEIVLATGALLLLILVIGAYWLLNRSSSQTSAAISDCANRSPLILAGSRKAEWVSFPAIAQIGMITVVCIGTLAGALAPPTAGDALCYHLEIPKRFVEHGSIEYLPLTDNSLFPFQMEMLYTLALLLGMPLLAPLLHWS